MWNSLCLKELNSLRVFINSEQFISANKYGYTRRQQSTSRILLGFSPNCRDIRLYNRKFAVGWRTTLLKVFYLNSH